MAGMGVLFDYIYIVRASPVSIHGGYLYFTLLYTKAAGGSLAVELQTVQH